VTNERYYGNGSPRSEELDDEEKEQRRLARIKAAEDRGKSWDKRVAVAATTRKKNV
jgi:hypothetical protein